LDAMDAMVYAHARQLGVRRPGMPEGVVLVPVSVEGRGGLNAFMVTPGAAAPWSPTMADVMADDWQVADWRGACG